MEKIQVGGLRCIRPLREQEEALLLAQLPPQRRERLLRTRRERWQEPLCAYGVLLQLLRETLGWRTLPAVACGEAGKPYFPTEPQVQFSLSHTEGAVLAAVSAGPVGVDVERLRPVSPRLRREFDGTRAAFFQNWVRLEALGKLSGSGVWREWRGGPQESDRFFYPLELWEGYAAGAASTQPDAVLQIRQYDLVELFPQQGE